MNLKFRLTEKSDLPGLKHLYERGFKREFSNELLEWILFTRTNNYKTISCVLCEGNEIIAHTAFLPMNFVFKSEKKVSLLSIGSVSIRAGLFPSLYRKCEKLTSGYDFIYSFPNQNSAPFFLKKFGFKEGYFEFLRKNPFEKKEIKVQNLKKSFNVEKFFYNTLTEDFLKWRLFTHPHNKYLLFNSDKGKVYFKFYEKNVIDVIALKPSSSILVMKLIVEFLSEYNNYIINIISTSKRFSSLLYELGFSFVEIPNKFVFKKLNKLKIDKEMFFLQMIDNDIY